MRPYSFILYEFLSVDKTDDVFGMESVPSMKFPEKKRPELIFVPVLFRHPYLNSIAHSAAVLNVTVW